MIRPTSLVRCTIPWFCALFMVGLAILPACSDAPGGDDDPSSVAERCRIAQEESGAQACDDPECADLEICLDTTAPQVRLTSPTSIETTDYELAGTVDDDGEVVSLTYTLDGGRAQSLEVSEGRFSVQLTLNDGENHLDMTATDASGNEGHLQATIRVDAARDLYANFTTSGALKVAEPVHFDGAASILPHDTSAEYYWDFGDGHTARSVGVSHVYDEPGTYVVTLRVVTETSEESVHIDNVEITGRDISSATGRLEGVVVDENGDPVVGASVSVNEIDRQTTSSGSGRWGFDEIPANSAMALGVSHEDYLDRVLRFEVANDQPETFLRIELVDPAASQAVDDASGETSVQSEDGASVEVEQGSLVDADGSPVTGGFEVVVTPVDIASHPERVPGGMSAVLADGSQTELQGAGAVHVAFFKDEQPISVAPGRTVSVRVPMYVPMASDGESLSTFGLSASSGLWLERSSATVEPSTEAVTASVATFEIERSGWWLVGDALETDMNVDGRCILASSNGQPSSGGDAGHEQDADGLDAGHEQDAGDPDAGQSADPATCWITASADGWWEQFGTPVGDAFALDAPGGDVCLSAMARGGLCRGQTCVTGSAGDTLEADVELECLDDNAQPANYGETIDVSVDADRLEVFEFTGQAGDGVVFQMDQQHPESLAGKLKLFAATGAEMAAADFGQDENQAIAAILPDDGQYYATVEVQNDASGTIAAKLLRREVLTVGDRGRGTLDYGEGVTYLVDTGADTLLNAVLTGDLGMGYNTTRFYWADLLSNSLQTARSGFERESGLIETSERFVQLRLSRDSWWGSSPTDFELTIAASNPTPQQLSFGTLGRAVASATIDDYGEHEFFQFDADQGDGLYVELRGKGATAVEAASQLGLRLWHTGTGTVWDGEDELYRIDKDPGVIGAMEAIQLRVPHSGAYVLEVFNYSKGDNPVQLGDFEISVDKVAKASDIVVGDSSCAEADTQSYSAATRAIEADGTLAICEGTYSSLAKGLIDRAGVTVKGAGPDKSFLRYTHQVYRDDGRVILAVQAPDVTIEDLGFLYYLPAEHRMSGKAFISDLASRRNWGASSGLTIRNAKLQVDTVSRRVSHGVSFFGEQGSGTSDINIENLEIDGANTGMEFRGDGFSIVDSVLQTRGTAIKFDGRDMAQVGATGFTVEGCTIDAGDVGLRGSNLSDVRIADNSIVSSDEPVILYLDRLGASTTDVVGNIMTSTDALSSIIVWQQGQSDTDPRMISISDNQADSAGRRLTGGVVNLAIRDATTDVEIARNLLDTGGGQGISVHTSGNPAGDLSIVNNVIEEDYKRNPAIDIDDSELFEGVEVLNNSVRAEPTSGWWGETHVGLRFGFDDLSYSGSLPAIVRNNIFRGPEDSGAHVGIELRTSQSVSIDSDYNLFFKYPEPYNGGQQTVGANDIIDQDPQFTNAQLEVGPNSPAVDAGTCNGVPSEDYQGAIRPQGASCDIGAYEQ